MPNSHVFVETVRSLFGTTRQEASDVNDGLADFASTYAVVLDSPSDQNWEGGPRMARRVGAIALGTLAIAYGEKILSAIVLPLLGPELAPLLGLVLVAVFLLSHWKNVQELVNQATLYLKRNIAGPIACILEM